MKTAIISDSSSNLPKEYLDNNDNLYIAPLTVSIDGKMYKDQIDISSTEVYDKLNNSVVQSSLPLPQDMNAIITEVKNKGYDRAIIITISSGLSGTNNAFRVVCDEHKDMDITLYDSKTLSMALGFIVMEAVSLAKVNMPTEDIITKLNTLRYDNMLCLYTISTLKHLTKGGRIGKVEGTIGDVLRIKPIISVNDDGIYFTVSKNRGYQRSIMKLVDLIIKKFEGKKVNIAIHYGDDLERAEALLEKLSKSVIINNSYVEKLTPVLGMHTGPGMFAIIAHEV